MEDNHTKNTWNQLANAYNQKFMDFDMYNDTYDAFCELVKKNAVILELGCGPGNITRYILKNRPDFNVLATDFAPAMVDLAKQNNPAAQCQVLDCREINALNKKFDAIIIGFCMPYLSIDECIKLVHDCAGNLATGGALYFSFIHGDPSQSGARTSSDGKYTMSMYYHEMGYMQKALADSGMNIQHIFNKDYQQPDRLDVHTIIIATR